MLSETKDKYAYTPEKLTSTISEKIHSESKDKIDSLSFSPSKDHETSNNYPSFTQYINPQRLAPYDDLLKKNIRSFNAYQNTEKKETEKEKKESKDNSNINNIDVPVIEINFKFTCDYDLIESEMKEFLELFGEIDSLNYNMNSNSLKIIYKYYISSMYANYYLNYLIYGNKRKKRRYESYLFLTQVDDEEQSNNIKKEKKKNSGLNEKQSEDILKFIKFLTENYKNEPKIKTPHGTPVKTPVNSSVNKKYDSNIFVEKLNSSEDKDIKNEEISNSDKDIIIDSSNDKVIINSEKKIYSNNINTQKKLVLQQNSETPIKKSNAFNNYSANNILSSTKKSNQALNTSVTPLKPFNPPLKPPLFCMPFFPNFNMKFSTPIPIPILFPVDASLLKKSFSNKKSSLNNNKDNSSEKSITSSLTSKPEENKINSSLMDSECNNPINILNDKIENENKKNENDNHIKDIMDNINNKIATANISNNSNNSTSSYEKNNINENNSNEGDVISNEKIKIDSESNKVMSSNSSSTIKTQEVNKSNNATDELKRILDIKNLEDIDINKSITSNEGKSNNKSSGSRLDFMSSFKGKTLSLERLNNYLQANQPVSNFNNPVLCLNPERNAEKEKEIEKLNDVKIVKKFNEDSKINDEVKINKEKEKQTSSQKKMNQSNNYFNPMLNFFSMPNMMTKKNNSPNKNIPFPIYPPIPPIPPMPFSYLPPYPYPYSYPPSPLFYRNNPSNFNKNVIDFNKMTLETKNKVHFMTQSPRNYYYKYVCNYTVQIENDNLFMVTKRIIGKNGCFLKKILQESCIKYGDYSTKIRLRGKGSGYVDKDSKSQNDEDPLMLSVSSLNYQTYNNCCSLVDKLMNKIYDDYYDHLLKVLPKELHPSIIKKKLIKDEFVVDRINSNPYSSSYYKNNMDENLNNSNSSEHKNEGINKEN